MTSMLKISLFTALLGLGLAGCSKEDAPVPATPTAAPTIANGNGETFLRTGERLTIYESLRSQNGQYQLVMQGDGNLVSRRLSDGAVIWNSATDGNPGAFCVMQPDGNFVVYSADGRRALYNTYARTSPRTDHFLVLSEEGQVLVFVAGNGDGGGYRILQLTTPIRTR